MQNMIDLFHGIIKITIAKLICIKLINNKYKCKLKNNLNLKKILIIHNINKGCGMIVILNIIFIIFNKKMEKKCYLIQQIKKQQKFVVKKQF